MAKFDLDTKINKYQFFHLLEEMSQVEAPLEEEGQVISPGEPVEESALPDGEEA